MRRLKAMCQTVTIVRAGQPTGEFDAYNNPTMTDDTRIHVVRGASLQPATSAETLTPSANLIVTGWKLFLPPMTVLATDRIQQAADKVSPVLEGDEPALDLQVDGRPGEWTVTGTGLDHIEVNLKLWEGS